MKKYFIKLNIPEGVVFNEMEFIQETIRPIPNGITITMREINEDVDIETNTKELTGEKIEEITTNAGL